MMGAMPNSLVSLGAQAASGTMNSIVTNVPGPPFPLYTLGAELLAMYPQVPLLPNVGLGIALISYNGNVCWGFNADLGLVPDLSDFVARIGESFSQLAEIAGVDLTRPEAAGEA
jgi:diacylglycerol O-acyltransferase